VSDELDGLLRAYRLATAEQDGEWSPIEDMRREHQANTTAREIADLLARMPAARPAALV
jgi:hypothetical protein